MVEIDNETTAEMKSGFDGIIILRKILKKLIIRLHVSILSMILVSKNIKVLFLFFLFFPIFESLFAQLSAHGTLGN